MQKGLLAAQQQQQTMIFFVAVCLLTTCTMGAHQQGSKDEIYTDQWAVHVQGGRLVADQVAHRHGFQNLGLIVQDYYHFQHMKVAKRSTEANEEHDLKLTTDPDVKWSKQQIAKKRVKRDYLDGRPSQQLNDPRWPQMWYLNRGRGLDMNVQAAWKKGVTGKGVVVTILDDGLEKDHPDIMRNFDPQASYDVNNHDEDPQPRYDLTDSNRHGTRCAGEVAADANNSICAVGVAYDASVGGVRMLDGDVTDAVEARSLSLNPQHVDVYSASWGPDDDGKTVDGPGELASRAFLEGIQHGRRGLGSIFVWASGNGGRDHDNCNCDGYTNSIWTLSISSATENGLVPWYSEACSSTLATTYSSGSIGEKQVVTTDLHYQCTSTHTGTSASAPLAAGICALALQVNPRLTWRDMQHIVVRTARPANLRAVDWVVNGVGRNVSHSFGYGLMDASAMVDLARNWTASPTQKMCKVPAPYVNKLIPAKSKVTLTLHVDCPDVKYLEHVQAKISLTASRRGDIQVFLTSAMGTRSCLLDIRPRDTSPAGFHSWPFMTVHNWGESPQGTWLLEIHNEGRYQAHITGWQLNMYGTKVKPGSAEAEEEAVRVANDKAKSLGVLRDPSSAAGEEEEEETSPRNDSSCSRRLSSGKCIECSGNYLLAEGECRLSCPGGFYASNGSDSNNWGPTAASCFSCHYSCKTCKGPNDYQCTSCHGDSELFKARCQPFELARIVSNANAWYYGMTATFVVMGIVILALVSYIILAKRKDDCGHVHGHSYEALGPCRDPEAKAAIGPFACESDESQNEDM